MAKASELADRMRRTALQGKGEVAATQVDSDPEPVPQAAPPVEAPVAAPTPIRAPRRNPTATPPKPATGQKIKTTSRYSIDLNQSERRALRLFAVNLDADVSEVIHSLISMLQESPELRKEVTNRVEAARQPALDD